MSWIIGGGGCQCFGQLIDTSGALVLLASALVTGFNPLQKWDAVASAKP